MPSTRSVFIQLDPLSHYVETIRNEAKRTYAQAYRAWRLGWTKQQPAAACSIMAAQAVRLRIDAIIDELRARHSAVEPAT